MRSVIVVMVMLLACSKRDAPDVAAAAGKVVELTGSVSASRAAAAPRALTVGDQVFADDVVDTGGDGSVTIELFHNHARWAMEPQQKKRVDESAAWRLAKQDSPTGPADHPTSAAGRNAERTAAETRATSGVASAGSANSAAQPPEPQAVPVETPKKPEAPKGGARDGKTSSAPAGGAGSGHTLEQGRDRVADPQVATSPEPEKPRTLDALTAKQAALAACIAAGAKITITVHVVKGKATAIDKDAKRKACLDAVLAKIELPSVDEDVSLQLAR